MSELRWNPLLKTWTIVAANRQARPNLPKGECPFCPGENKKVPKNYDVFCYPNDYPALSKGIEGSWSVPADDLYNKAEGKGNCEVILYTSQHHQQLYHLSDEHVLKLVNLWVERFVFYKAYHLIKYVYIFENKGEVVGVTMPHPHGQLYAFPYVPLKLEVELDNAKEYYTKNQRNLFQDMIDEEKRDGRRIIFETEHFIVFLPYFTDYPYGIFIVSKSDVVWIDELSSTQRLELGIVLKQVSGMFDALYDSEFPYMMCMHQGSINDERYKHQKDFFRFHIEYYPPFRAPNTIKYYASTESGAWAAANTRTVEETALELRAALEKFKSSRND